MSLFDLIFNPTTDPIPAPGTDKKTKRTKKTPAPRPDNLTWDNHGRGWLMERDKLTGTTEWDQWKEGTEFRDSKVREADQDQITEHGLNEDKYRKIKARWSQTRQDGQYKSARDTSTELTREHGRGFSLRLVQAYYGAINRANPSPAD